jgi:hypothetical protein
MHASMGMADASGIPMVGLPNLPDGVTMGNPSAAMFVDGAGHGDLPVLHALQQQALAGMTDPAMQAAVLAGSMGVPASSGSVPAASSSVKAEADVPATLLNLSQLNFNGTSFTM